MAIADAPHSDRHIPTQYDERGEPFWRSTLTPPDPSYGICAMVPDRVIPVIFVPGIMGSNLKSRVGGNPPWRLDSNVGMLPWSYRGPAKRRRYLNPATMTVDGGGKIASGTQQIEAHLRDRGWGEVGYTSYGEFLAWLENALNDFDDAPHHHGERDQLVGKVLGAVKGEEPLTRDEVALSYRYRFPVWACGYNWLGDNKASATRLKQRITDVIGHYKKKGKPCEKVILVTHSMGGLVARCCTEVLGEHSRVFGVIHGVMPATGAAATYRRAKAGTRSSGGVSGWLTSLVLGADAAEMTAVLSTAPGALELLPMQEYGNGWLHVQIDGQDIRLPQGNDPYGEIYTVRGKWWGLIDDALMNPLNDAPSPAQYKSRMDADWANYTKIIAATVMPFQQSIASKYNHTTYAFYANGKDHLAYGNVTWKGHDLFGENWSAHGRQTDPLEGRNTHIAGTGGTTRSVFAAFRGSSSTNDGMNQNYTLSGPDEAGDGTVPERSGVAPKPFSRSVFTVDVEHEGAFRDCMPARRFTLRAVVKIAQAVKATGLAYS